MQTRLDFLASGTLAALAPPAASASPSPKPSPKQSMPPLNFDLAAFDAALNTTAAHKHLFASTKIEGGLVLGQMRGVLDAYKEIGVPANAVHPVAVFYHGASVLLAFDDTIWSRYFIPLESKQGKDVTVFAKDIATVYEAGKTKGNPCLHKTGADDDSSIETLVAMSGARFFACNNATTAFSEFIARQLKLDAVAVYRDLAAHLVPNAMLVPAGIWAVPAIQERRYTYQQSTLQG